MTTLLENINDSQTLIPISGPLTNGTFQYPLYFTVDSESIRVVGRAIETTWLVDRGIAGTTAASHSSGATLTRYYPEAATGAGAGGVTVDNQTDPPAEVTTLIAPGATIAGDEATLPSGAQTVTRLGPFRVRHDSAGVTAGFGVTVADIPEGAAIVRAWVIAVEAADEETLVGLFIHDGTLGQGLEAAATYLDLGGPYGSAHWQIEDNMGEGGAAQPSTRVALATGANAHLSCKFVYSGAPATEGEVDVHALIAEPAA